MLRLRTLGFIGMMAASLAATPVLAHPKLLSVSPRADAPIRPAPKEIKLNFTEGVIAKFSGVELKDQSGKTVPTGASVADPKDRKQLIVPLLEPLTAGSYTVNWHAVSEDTHRVKGQYSFTVAR